jgi:hypothetical protein
MAADATDVSPFPADGLRTGDVLLMLGDGPLSELIAWASDGPYSHAAIVADDGDLIEATSRGVVRTPLPAKLADRDHYHFIDAMRMDGTRGPGLAAADAAAVLARAASLLGTPYPLDQLALFGVIMAVRGKWPRHALGRLLVRVALDHALPDDTGQVVCSEVVYRAYAECAVEPSGRLAPVIVVGGRGTAPFPDIDWKALFDELWPLLGPRDREALEPARPAFQAAREGGAGLLRAGAPSLPVVGDDELEAARRAVLGHAGLPGARSGALAQRADDPGTVVPDPNPRLVSPQDLAASPSFAMLGRLMQRRDPQPG